MFWLINGLVFLASCIILYISGEIIVKSLSRLAKHLGVTEFVVAFFVMAAAASLPNLFVGITSALKGIPELSFGDIMGNNIIAMTLAVALAVVFAPKKEIPSDGQTTQSTIVFTVCSAILPVLLISDGILSRLDGIILILFFAYYSYWIFSKRERFSKVYLEEEPKPKIFKEFKLVLIDLLKIIVSIFLLILSAQGIVYVASAVAIQAGISVILIGLLITGFGSALPEIYFAISSAKKGETDMILGNLLGAVIIPASLVLGIISIIKPIQNNHLEFPLVSRLFLILAAIVFFVSARTNKEITKREGFILLVIYALFVVSAVMV